jgi:hypothetical protein
MSLVELFSAVRKKGWASATADTTVTQPLAVPVGLVAVVFARLIA